MKDLLVLERILRCLLPLALAVKFLAHNSVTQRLDLSKPVISRSTCFHAIAILRADGLPSWNGIITGLSELHRPFRLPETA